MRMQKQKFRIGKLAKKLQIERFVIRFWEKEFDLTTVRSTGGQRFYNENDFKQFFLIKELLYKKGFTISGAKKQLKNAENYSHTIIVSQKTTLSTAKKNSISKSEDQKKIEMLSQQIVDLKNMLRKLRELL